MPLQLSIFDREKLCIYVFTDLLHMCVLSGDDCHAGTKFSAQNRALNGFFIQLKALRKLFLPGHLPQPPFWVEVWEAAEKLIYRTAWIPVNVTYPVTKKAFFRNLIFLLRQPLLFLFLRIKISHSTQKIRRHKFWANKLNFDRKLSPHSVTIEPKSVNSQKSRGT